MAIINSVLTGKAKGKIGNIVLATVKGQTIAREYNSNPTYSDTAGQTLQRGRLRNAVLAWQFLNIFLQYAKPLAKSTESVYNAFIRMIVNLLPENTYATRAEAGGQALAKIQHSGNFVTITGVTLTPGNATVSFDVNYFPFVQGCKVVFVDYNTATGYRFLMVLPLLPDNWADGEVFVADVAVLGVSCAAYIVSADGSKMSNIFNVE